MDPDENLLVQRIIATRILAGRDTYAGLEHDAERLAELVQALDEWIRNGGFLPRQWRRT